MTTARQTSPLAGKSALIVGAGVGGLATASALRLAGVDVELLEQAGEISEVGAGLQISPNGTRVLEALGLHPHEIGDRTQAVELRDQSGRLVSRLDLPQTPGFFLCHRADLIAGLEGRARDLGTKIHLLQHVEKIELNGADPELVTTVGAKFSASLAIGADGLHSHMRRALNTDKDPFFTGQVAWRATIPGDGGPPVAQIFMGPGRHLVSYPLRGGTLRNIVAVQERRGWAAEGWNHPDDPETLRAVFERFGGPVPEWLAAIDTLWLWGLFRHPVARHWHDPNGRAALVGDAAHPTLPFMAQGANMALEDAWSLAANLQTHPEDQTRALARYSAQRSARCRAIVKAASKNARNYHLRAPVAPIAHGILRLGDRLAPGAALRRYAWIYDHDVAGSQA